jgi:hypothetical protein
MGEIGNTDEEIQLMIQTQTSGHYDAQFQCEDGETFWVRNVYLPWRHAGMFHDIGDMVKSFSECGGCDFVGGNFYHPKEV